MSRSRCGCEQNLRWYYARLRECLSFEVAICDLKRGEARTAYDLAGGSRKPIFRFGISSGAMSSLMASMRS
jgi:hypothetical protein